MGFPRMHPQTRAVNAVRTSSSGAPTRQLPDLSDWPGRVGFVVDSLEIRWLDELFAAFVPPAHPFTAPAVMPLMIYRCATK